MVFDQLILAFQSMTSSSMHCANKAATVAAARMCTAVEKSTQDSAAGVSSPAAADKHPATPNGTGSSGHSRAASSSAALATCGCHMNVDTEIEVIYSEMSDPPFDSRSPGKPGRQDVGAQTTSAKSPESVTKALHHDIFGSSDESEHSSRGSNRSRSHSCDASAQHHDVDRQDDVDDSSRSHRNRSNFSDCGDCSAVIYVGTAQEEQDRNV